ncbi:MAG: hypothetical protein ACRC1W_12815 [Shewanella sp.]
MIMKTEMSQEAGIRETGEMTKQAKALFVRLWKAEHKAYARYEKAVKKLELAEILEMPCERLAATAARASAKAIEIDDMILDNVVNGTFTVDADITCRDNLGDLDELIMYVSHYHAEICVDARWLEERAKLRAEQRAELMADQ